MTLGYKFGFSEPSIDQDFEEDGEEPNNKKGPSPDFSFKLANKGSESVFSRKKRKSKLLKEKAIFAAHGLHSSPKVRRLARNSGLLTELKAIADNKFQSEESR